MIAFLWGTQQSGKRILLGDSSANALGSGPNIPFGCSTAVKTDVRPLVDLSVHLSNSLCVCLLPCLASWRRSREPQQNEPLSTKNITSVCPSTCRIITRPSDWPAVRLASSRCSVSMSAALTVIVASAHSPSACLHYRWNARGTSVCLTRPAPWPLGLSVCVICLSV
jgi:hypothetical protein